MKIIISDKEFYQLEMPAEISFKDFKILVEKLNVVVNFVEGKNTSAKQISQGSKPKQRTREDIVQLVKAALTLGPGTPEMDEVLKRYGIVYNTLNQFKWRWLEKYKITAQEIGLEELPKKQEGRPSIN